VHEGISTSHYSETCGIRVTGFDRRSDRPHTYIHLYIKGRPFNDRSAERDMWHSIETRHSNGDLIAPPFKDRSAYSTPIGWNREIVNGLVWDCKMLQQLMSSNAELIYFS